MYGRTGRTRCGLTLLEVSVLLALAAIIGAFVIWRISAARETFRGNACRQNLRELAVAVYDYQARHGHYPGYLNVQAMLDGKPLVDVESGLPTPVSWVVLILPYLEQSALYRQWQEPADADGAARRAVQPLPVLHCPSETPRPDPLLSYVVNTGMPDAPAAVIDAQAPSRNIPRDWPANGMFFDRFSESPLIKPDPQPRGPMVTMTFDQVRDLKSRTILLAENVDAGSHVFTTANTSAAGWRRAEIDTGCIWRSGTFASQLPPQLTPGAASAAINVAAGRGDGKSFDFCRPSSRHPRAVNVAFVEQNVTELSDAISYFVYVKLMTSDDANIAPAGLLPTEANLNQIDPHRLLRESPLPGGPLTP